MTFHITLEDPNQPDVLRLLEDGEAYGAALYPAESNHYLPIEALRGAHMRFAVARNEHGQAVGTGAIALNEGWAELKRMWVAPAARGRGLSKALLANLEARAASAGIFVIRLETGIENHEALGLYERSGYVRREAFADYLPDPLSVFMEKTLQN
jgi:putative acetyltransferase